MTAVAKREKTWKSKLVPGKAYPIEEALGLVKEFASPVVPSSAMPSQPSSSRRRACAMKRAWSGP